MWKCFLVALAIAIGLMPAAVFAQEADDQVDDVLIRINGPIQVRAEEFAEGVVVVGDDAFIEGTVDYLLVINGNATITGTVNRTVTMVNGTVTLKDGARVEEDVQLYRADAVQEAGATVVGDVREEWGGFNVGRGFWLGLWLSMTIAVLAAGLLFAAVGGRQLAGAGRAVSGQVWPTLLGAVVLWVGVPMLAVLAMLTLIGIPLGLGILFFLLPALWFAGYLVAGAALGLLLFARMQGVGTDDHPYVAVTVGLLIFQVVALVPLIGGAVAFVAGLIGAGSLVYRAWTAFRGDTTDQPAIAPPSPAAPTV
jgi:hypothetical protein